MSITISFTMEPKMSLTGTKPWDGEQTAGFTKGLAKELGYHCDVISGYVVYQLCPEGFLWMTWKGKQLVGDCQTNIAGPGFHAAVVYFLELFAARGSLKLSVKDPTGFYADRNFERMRREYFYGWFKKLLHAIVSRVGTGEGKLVCWPSDYYLPQEQPGIVTTHIRGFGVRELKGIVQSGLTNAFAKDFFVWCDEEKDAWYFRNCALVLLNQQCYFKPSSRSNEDLLVNREVIRLLEKTLEMDRTVPFPVAEYREVCALDGHEPADLTGVCPMTEEQPVGCRRGLLQRTIGRMRFAVPGSFLYDLQTQGNSERYYDESDGNRRDYYICAVKTEGDAQIRPEPFERETVLRTEEFAAGGAIGKLAVYKPSKRPLPGKPAVTNAVLVGESLAFRRGEPQEDTGLKESIAYTVAAQIAYRDQLTIVSITSGRAEDEAWAIDLIRKVEIVS